MTDDHDVGALERVLHVVVQQPGDVGQCLFQKGAIGTVQPSQRDRGIVNQQIDAFADQSLRQFEQRAFAQIISSGLER